MKKKSSKSEKKTKPVKGIKHHGIISGISFILIIVAVFLLISHPGEVIFGFFSLLGSIASISFGAVVIFLAVAFVAYIVFKFLL